MTKKIPAYFAARVPALSNAFRRHYLLELSPTYPLSRGSLPTVMGVDTWVGWGHAPYFSG